MGSVAKRGTELEWTGQWLVLKMYIVSNIGLKML